MKKEEIDPRVNVARRLNIAKGHLAKVIEMVEGDVYCIDILQQTSAVRNGIKKAEEILLGNHLNQCVAKAINSGAKDKAIEELTQVFNKMA